MNAKQLRILSFGGMGYMIGQLGNELQMREISRSIVTLVTQVLVDSKDPDFNNPSKFIGPNYSSSDAEKKKRADGWVMKPYKMDSKSQEIWRRVVPSPVPLEILELDAIEDSVRAGRIVVAVGGGGIPVVEVKPNIEGYREVELLSNSPELFPAGSMGPKIRSVIQFLEGGGRVAFITMVENYEETLKGKKGTTIVP